MRQHAVRCATLPSLDSNSKSPPPESQVLACAHRNLQDSLHSNARRCGTKRFTRQRAHIPRNRRVKELEQQTPKPCKPKLRALKVFK